MSSEEPQAPGSNRDEAYRADLQRIAFPPLFTRIVRGISRVMLKITFKLYFRMTTVGLENVPKEGAFLLAMNHASHLDPMIIGASSIRYPKIMGRDDLFKIPFVGWWIASIGAFPVKRGLADRRAMALSIDMLKLGVPVGIYPEGTRTEDGSIGQANPGLAMLAMAVPGVPILPVNLDGSFAAFPRGAKFPKPARITVYIGKPFRVDEIPNAPQEKKALYRAVGDETMRAIIAAKR